MISARISEERYNDLVWAINPERMDSDSRDLALHWADEPDMILWVWENAPTINLHYEYGPKTYYADFDTRDQALLFKLMWGA